MPLYEKSWWKKLFKKEHHEKQVDALTDIQAIAESLIQSKKDTELLLKQLGDLEELERERQVATQGVVQINIDAQAKLMDKLLFQYEDHQNDVDIDGLRIKRVARHLLREAEKAGMHDLVKEKKKDQKWQFWW
ncbi:MAG: hypothetical protein WCV90_08195 [Candidatus Woesearchaeota archaeon]|jgi:hypothetical protein